LPPASLPFALAQVCYIKEREARNISLICRVFITNLYIGRKTEKGKERKRKEKKGKELLEK